MRRSGATRAALGVLLLTAFTGGVAGCSDDGEGRSATTSTPPAAGVAATDPSASYTTAPPDGRGAEQPTTAPAPDLTGTRQPRGSINRTVAPRPVRTTSAGSAARVDSGSGVQVSVVQRQPVKATAKLPGEVSGEALKVSVRIVNDSPRPVDLGAVTVDLRDAGGASASPVTTPPARPLRGVLEPGAEATGTYVFVVDAAARRGSTLLVSPSASSTVSFPGDP